LQNAAADTDNVSAVAADRWHPAANRSAAGSGSPGAENGYGEVNDEAFQEVPLEQLPEDARVVGAMLQAQGFPGPLRAAEIKEDVAVLDFNHPLAGKDLSFDITIVAVEDAPPAPVN
jgi:FKBP-type peptidyl-prolyl cis-trans isomerase 2